MYSVFVGKRQTFWHLKQVHRPSSNSSSNISKSDTHHLVVSLMGHPSTSCPSALAEPQGGTEVDLRGWPSALRMLADTPAHTLNDYLK